MCGDRSSGMAFCTTESEWLQELGSLEGLITYWYSSVRVVPDHYVVRYLQYYMYNRYILQSFAFCFKCSTWCDHPQQRNLQIFPSWDQLSSLINVKSPSFATFSACLSYYIGELFSEVGEFSTTFNLLVLLGHAQWKCRSPPTSWDFLWVIPIQDD